MIEITAETMERAQKVLAGIPKGAERAFSNAINRALAHTKSQAFKEVRQVYAVQQKDLDSATATRVQKASTGNTVGYVLFSGVKIPLYKFNVSPSEPKKSKNIKAGLRKGSWTAFDHAFIAQMDSGHIGIFERTGEQGIESRLAKTKDGKGTKHTETISQIMGLSGAQMIQNGEVEDHLSQEAQEKFEQRVEHEINRILNGYGG